MADNVTLASGDVVRTKDIGGVEYQVIQVADALGNIIDSVLLQNGRGLLMVNLADQAVKGTKVIGQVADTQPVAIGGRVSTSLESILPEPDGDLQAAALTADGRLTVAPYCTPESQAPSTPIVLTTTADVLVYTNTTVLKWALIGVSIVNSSATNTAVIVKNGTTEIGRIAAPANYAPNVQMFTLPLKTSVNAILNFALSVAVATADVRVTPFAYRTRL
jgi:hypothetical protein